MSHQAGETRKSRVTHSSLQALPGIVRSSSFTSYKTKQEQLSVVRIPFTAISCIPVICLATEIPTTVSKIDKISWTNPFHWLWRDLMASSTILRSAQFNCSLRSGRKWQQRDPRFYLVEGQGRILQRPRPTLTQP